MSFSVKAVAASLVCWVSLMACAASHAQVVPEIKVGDRVEVEHFGEWRPGKVLEIDSRFQRATVLLDKADVPPQLAGRVPKEVLQSMRETSVRLRDVRPLDRKPTGRPREPQRSTTPEEPRVWTSKSGKFSVRATFLGLNNGKVALEKMDGKRIEVALDQLSDADVAYTRRAGRPADPAPSAEGGVAKAKWSGVKEVRPRTFSKWSFQPEAVAAPDGVKPGPAVTLEDIPGSRRFFEDVLVFRVAADGSRALVAREKGQVGGEDERFLQLLNLEQGKAGQLVGLPAQTAILDADPASGRVAYRPDIFGSGENMLLTIAQIGDGGLTTLTSWRPYEKADWDPEKDIKDAWFLGADRVMTINGHGEALTVWDVEQARALLNIPVASAIQLKLALSPDRTLLAIGLKDGVALIDLTEGRHVGTLPTDEEKKHYDFAFCGTNQRLAGLCSLGVTVWDLTTGEAIRQLAHPVISGRGELHWAGGFLLVNRQYLFDVDRRILLWQYETPSRLAATEHEAGRLCFVTKATDESPSVVVSAEVPHQAAVEKARSLGTPESLLVVKPGDAVKIELDVDPSAGSAAEVRNAIEANAKQAGLVVDDSAPLVLTAVCKRLPQQTLKINTGDRLRPSIVERTVVPHASSLEMTLGGETLFKTGFTARPGIVIWLRERESLDAALKRLTSPNLRILTHTPIPSELGRPGQANENGAYGVSTITAQGSVGGSGARFE